MEFTIEHRDGLASLVHLTMQPDEPVLELTDALAMARNVGEDTVIWLHGSNPERAEVMAATGRTTNRTLLQMRVPLPACLLYTSPSPRDKRQSRMPSSA